MITLRDANLSDLPTIQSIYAHHVMHGSASFEITPPGEAEIRARFETITAAGYPYIVACDQNAVLGFAYASAYRSRPAYRFSVEDSIYVRAGESGRGIGKQLLDTLMMRCAAQGYRLMIAVIGDSQNVGSISLHARCGFRFAGVLPSVGYKHHRWIDSVLMTCALGEGDRSAPSEIMVEVPL